MWLQQSKFKAVCNKEVLLSVLRWHACIRQSGSKQYTGKVYSCTSTHIEKVDIRRHEIGCFACHTYKQDSRFLQVHSQLLAQAVLGGQLLTE